MKKVTKFFMAALLAGMCSLGYAQKPYLNPPLANEKKIGMVSTNEYKVIFRDGSFYYREFAGIHEWHDELLKKAKKQYPNIDVSIREMNVGTQRNDNQYYGPAYGTVVTSKSNEDYSYDKLPIAINKALSRVPENTRMAIDQISVTSNMDKEELKDQLIDILLEKGYRVVAKEYLQKLYEEQKDQESGLYNPDTTVEGSNFSAVGYFINVKVTESSIRVQVVNVSTGEYEGNATVNF